MARCVPAGSKLIFQMHYTPNGSAQQDRSYLRLRVRRSQDGQEGSAWCSDAANAVFQIPPGDDDFAVQSRYIFRKDAMLLTLMPHMHLRGKAFRYEATYPDGKSESCCSTCRGTTSAGRRTIGWPSRS